MRMNSNTEDGRSGPTDAPADGKAEAPPRALIEAATERAEQAEARARALEAENRELRSERARAALAAAQNEPASPEAASLRAAHAEAKARSLEAENQQLRSVRAESALAAAESGLHALEAAGRRAEAAEARALALETENKQLRAERAKAVMAAARAESAATENRAAADEPAPQILALSNELKTAEGALRASEREREAAARALEGSLRREFSERLDALRQGHAAELEARAREAKTRSAEELMSAMSTANAAWQKDTESQLRNTKKKAEIALTRAHAIWRLRSRVALLQAARVWRGRERERLADAKRKWEIMHREAIDACNRRWQAKMGRLKGRLRRPLLLPLGRSAAWRGAIERLLAVAKLGLRSAGRAIATPMPRQRPIGDAGFVAVIVLLLALFLPPTAPFTSADAEPMAASAGPAASERQIASAPSGSAGDEPASDARRQPAAKPKDDPKASQKGQAPSPSRQSDVKRERPAAGHANAAAPQAPAKPAAGSGTNEEQTDSELRLRLMEKIQRLRSNLSVR